MIIFFNPYESGESTGATRRIAFLLMGLEKIEVESKSILLDDILRMDKLAWLTKLPIINRLFYFIFIYYLALTGKKVITEVIFSPVWNRNVFLTVHDLKAFDDKAKRGNGKKNIYKIFCKLAHKIITVSEYSKNELKAHCNIPAQKIIVIPNGISQERVSKLELCKSDVEFDYVYVSSFAKHKRHAQLIRALPENTSLLLIGRDFGELSHVQKEASSRSNVNISIRCDVDIDAELFYLLKASRVGVFPSVYEGFGIPLLEYYAAGLVVVASDIEPFKELSKFVDYFHAADDLAALSTSLQKALRHNYIAKEKAKLQQYTESNIADLLIKTVAIPS